MKTSDVITYYGSITRAAKALNVSRVSLYKWGEYVPPARQYELEVKTGGKLKSDYTQARDAGTPAARKKKGKG